MTKLKGHLPVILAGLVVGIASVVLVALGNPVNMASVSPASCGT